LSTNKSTNVSFTLNPSPSSMDIVVVTPHQCHTSGVQDHATSSEGVSGVP
jgi:hypothetical protein